MMPLIKTKTEWLSLLEKGHLWQAKKYLKKNGFKVVHFISFMINISMLYSLTKLRVHVTV